MKVSIFFIICTYFVKMQYTMCSENVSRTLDEYLTNSSKSVRKNFSQKNHTRRRETQIIEIKQFDEVTLNKEKDEQFYRTNFLETEFIIAKNKVLYHENINDNYAMNHNILSFIEKKDVIYIRVIQYNQLRILLLATKSKMHIYRFYRTENYFAHSISTPDAVDAQFFINNGDLYLIVASSREDNLMPTSIYQWLGTHFDEIETIFTTGAVKIKTFHSGRAEIIIILQDGSKRQTFSTVYEFNFGKLRKTQHLHTTSPVHAEKYVYKNNIYVTIFEKSKTNKVYKWDEKSTLLIEISGFKTPHTTEKSAVIQANGSTSIILPLIDKIQIYLANLNGLKLEMEENYTTTYSNIIDILKGSNNGTNIIYVVGLTPDKAINISAIYLNINTEHYYESEKNNGLRDCFNSLEQNVYNQRKILREFKNITQIKDNTDSRVKNITKSIQRTAEEEPDYETNIEEVLVKLNDIEPLLKAYQDIEGDNMIINGNVVINGLLESERLSGKNINVKKINGNKWTPEQWLMYEEPQTVTGPVKIENIHANQLATSREDTTFTELLRKNGNQEISGEVTIKNLTANEIFLKQINDVKLEDVYLKNNPEPIRGLKTFQKFKATEAQIDLLNGKKPDAILSLFADPSSKILYDSQLEVENLVAEWIDDVHWDTFKKSVFRIGKTSEINGNLTFSELKTENLTLKTLNGVRVDDFLTTSTDQVIESDIEFGRIFAESITTNTTNNIKLQDVVRFGDDRLVEGPVKFDRLHVSKNLKLVGELDEEFFLRNGDHIIGTNESDLLQTYNGKVRIKGNLFLKNITLQPKSQLFLSDDEINPNISEIYWTKSTNQIIPVRFQAQNGVTVPHLLTDMINNIKISQYMLNNNEDKFETSFRFRNVNIVGDIILNNNAKHTPDLNAINKNGVKTNGSFFLTGKKTYTDTLRIKKLITHVLDNINMYEVLTQKWSGVITGKKTFKNVIVKGNLSSDFSSEYVNGVNIKQLAKNVIYIDQPRELNRLHFKNITVSNLYVSRLNDHHMNEYILNLEKLYSSDNITNLRIEGDVRLKDVKNVSKINDIEVEKLTENAIRKTRSGAFLVNVTFLGHLKVHNLVTKYINDVDLTILTTRFLHRHTNQTVKVPFSFTKIKAKNVVASKINDISVKNLVDVSSNDRQTIYAPQGVEFLSANLTSLKANETYPCDLKEALRKIRDPPSQDWHTILIKGNVTLMDPENVLYRVFEKSVGKKSKNIIYSPVNFTNHILAENVLSNGYINGVNLEDIIDDAVVVDSKEEQVITGHKTFSTINVPSAKVSGNTDSPVVNKMDIPEINKSLVRRSQIPDRVIRGKKTFYGGLDAIRFYGEKVGNTDPDNIVNLENLRKIPRAIFDSLEVENNLNLGHINRMPFTEILQKRLLTDKLEEQVTNGLYYFDNIEIENLETPSINEIGIDDIVFDIDQQNIFGSKRFLEPVEIHGNAQSDYINGVDIKKTQEKSVLPGENVTVNGSITILRPSVVKGIINAESINGYPIANLKEILNKGATKSEIQKIHSIKDDITQMVQRNHRVQSRDPYLGANLIKEMPSEYMYLEKSDVLQISVPNTISAKTVSSKGYVLIHITGEESGEYCGLPSVCTCPVQYSLEISPEHSVAVFVNKDLQRTFSYSDENMIIHFKTNSISTDSVCRTKEARVLNEVSMMSWSTLPTKNTTGTFYQYDKLITGYISGAEFFTLNGKSYAIIGRFYDPTADTHDLDCIVIRFSEDKSKANEIQRIRTRGAWSMYLFHTAQGVTLIVGNMGNTHIEEEETVIYRFHEDNQQFKILRIVPSYGSFITTGVVLGADSLIVLAHKTVPLQVLKYNHIFDNYYFYQSFELESPVQGISVFYTGGFGISDAYLCIVTKNENYFIYSIQFIEGWKLESNGELDGLKNLIPFELNKQPYLFAPSTYMSSLLTVVKHGSV